MRQPLLVQQRLRAAQGIHRQLRRRLAGKAAQAAGMHDDAVAAQPVHDPRALQDIGQAVVPLLRVTGGERNIIGRVQRDDNPAGSRPGPQRARRFLPHAGSVPALVFVDVQPLLREPGEHIDGILITGVIKGIAVPRRAELNGHRRLLRIQASYWRACPSSRLPIPPSRPSPSFAGNVRGSPVPGGA